MPEIRIDANLCQKDGLCTLACPVGIFEQKKRDAVPAVALEEMCIGCGHCVAVCPHGAISHSDYPEGTATPVAADRLPDYDQVLELVRTRRSKRRFRNEVVEKDVIERVLEAARFAPSGHNAQPVEYVVVRDKEALQTIGTLTVNALEKMMKPFKSPIGRAVMRFVVGKRQAEAAARFAPAMDGVVKLYRSGHDVILNRAPVLILFHADSAGVTHSVDANLALQNATLAAEAAGLGCFYAGFVLGACGRDKSIARFLSLPETNAIYGALAMGHPKLKYGRWPERRPLRVTWV